MTGPGDDNPPVAPAEFDSELKRREEEKRDRMTSPTARWKLIQQAITWAEQQKTVRRNTREECLRRQAILLAGLAIRAALPNES
jgi:hypothetical protein